MTPERALLARYGHLDAIVCPGSPDVLALAQLGVLGDGCSAGYPAQPNEEALVRWGEVDRVLQQCDVQTRAVLAIAYGDAGAIVTRDGAYESQRWRAVAPLTSVAVTWGQAWAEHHRGHGPPGARYVDALGARIATRTASRDDRARWEQLRTEARAMLAAALAEFRARWAEH